MAIGSWPFGYFANKRVHPNYRRCGITVIPYHAIPFFEFREDEAGEVLHLVTLWKSTAEEIKIYEENA